MRLQHPEHGFHVASYGDDLEALRKSGWTPCDEVKDAEPQEQQQAAVEPKRRGRKPKAE